MGVYNSMTEWNNRTNESRVNKRRRDLKQLRKEMANENKKEIIEIDKLSGDYKPFVPRKDYSIIKSVISLFIAVILTILFGIFIFS